MLTTHPFLAAGSCMGRTMHLHAPYVCLTCYRTAFTTTYWSVSTSVIFWLQLTALLYPSTVHPALSLSLPNRFQFLFFPYSSFLVVFTRAIAMCGPILLIILFMYHAAQNSVHPYFSNCTIQNFLSLWQPCWSAVRLNRMIWKFCLVSILFKFPCNL